ncbi:MAG: ABC transporter ATP-binding protein [Planctomycetaceae bacterium]|nr:ABC transporter ATP-binding protein [Planctomycetaceae bacterium]
MRPVISLRNISKKFGKKIAVEGLSLEATPGQVVALLGDNGAGKSTTIKILLGLLRPDVGESAVLGMDSRRQSQEIRRRIGYVPDKPALYDWMTVTEIGWFASGFYPHGYLEEYAEMVKAFHLPETEKIKNLSRGMQAKVSLALAMAHKPELLILDEPTSGLDAVVRREFLESMVDVAAEGRTVLLASHQIHEVERVADSVAIMRQSELLTYDRLEVLKNEVLELVITHDSEDRFEFPFADKQIASRHDGRQSVHLVRDMTPSQMATLENQPQTVHLERRTPSLEEIFVGYMLGEIRKKNEQAPHTEPEISA